MPRLIDLKVLDSLRELSSEKDPEFLKNYFSLFLKTLPNLMTQIQNAIKSQEPKAVEMAAHALKSSSLNSGFISIGNLCLEIENLGKNKSFKETSERFEKLKVLCKELEAEIMSLPEFK